MSNRQLLKKVKIKITMEVYDKSYGTWDVHHLVNLFNEMHNPQMVMVIEEINELK